MLRQTVILLGLMGILAPGGALAASASQHCMAAIAVLEAAGEGRLGMAAVLDVVRNRVRDDRFPNDACAVIRQKGQFQPVGEWPKLKQLLQQPETFDARPLLGNSKALETAYMLASAKNPATTTGGALYFLNPRLMDKRHCPWFASLKRTMVIGEHIFMTEYEPGEKRQGVALDCDDPTIGSGYGFSLAKRYANGLFTPSGAKVATNTPTRNQRRAWQRTGQMENRQKDLKRFFKPGWIKLD